MKKYFFFLLAGFLSVATHTLHAQPNYQAPQSKYRVAIFAPLYLDSAFSAGKLKNPRVLPRQSMPAAEFVQGAQIALDTLNTRGKTIEAFIYDSKSATRNVAWLIRYRMLDSMDLIIGSVKDPEYSQLAHFAAQRKIPFVSSTFPNDGGVRSNPYLLIVNSTLQAHCESIFSYLVQKYGADNIYLAKRKNENRIENIFKTINQAEGKPLLNIRSLVLDTSVTTYQLKTLVDTSRPSIIIGATLDEFFATKLATAMYPIQKTNNLSLIGMPNWDGFRSLYKKDAFKDFPVKYTTPHYDLKTGAFGRFLTDNYFHLYRAAPTDMAFKGFETTYYFMNILLQYGRSEFMNHLNEPAFAGFHEFNFRPVYFNKQSTTPDYYENRRLFIMQILNGENVRQW